MKCPECGQWNRASMPHCSRCGAPLNIDAASRLDWKETLQADIRPPSYLRADEFGQVEESRDMRDVLAVEMQELKKRKQEGAKLQERLRASGGNTSGQLVIEEESSSEAERSSSVPDPLHPVNTIHLRRVSADHEASEQERLTRHRVRFMDEAGVYVENRTYDPLYPEVRTGSFSNPLPYTGRIPQALPSRLRRRRTVHRVFLILLFVALFAAGLGFGYRFYVEKRLSARRESPAIVTASLLNDIAAHTILIPGENGTIIYIRELHASYPVVDGFATVEVADHIWYDNVDTALEETMEVTLTPFLKASAGRQMPMDPIYYTIDIPLSPITLETPDSMRSTVSTSMATIRISVRPGSHVTVNGEDYSDTVSSENGEMSYNATVQPIGDNEFTFVVRSQYCRDNTLTVTLYRAPQEIPLDLAVGTYGSTDREIMPVTATTLAGAYVQVTTPHSDLNITELDSTGKFTFNAIFDHIGYNTISITASYPGKKPSTVDHTVYYLPPASKYTTKAWPLSPEGYGELLSNMSVRAANNQVYVVTGIVQYQVSAKPQQVVINTSEDGKSQPVLLQNYTNTTWVVGRYYRIFADAYTTYNGMPWLNARYTYTK